MKIIKRTLLINSLFLSFNSSAGLVDLNKPFICPDISPIAMQITKDGLKMGGVFYSLTDPNASSAPSITNAIFSSDDGLNEIDIKQYTTGTVDVSYIKFSIRPYDAGINPDEVKIFEKASFSVENPPSYFSSQNKGCRN